MSVMRANSLAPFHCRVYSAPGARPHGLRQTHSVASAGTAYFAGWLGNATIRFSEK